MAYQAPFVSGKDSLSNQFTTEDGRLITIPPTMLISALAATPKPARGSPSRGWTWRRGRRPPTPSPN